MKRDFRKVDHAKNSKETMKKIFASLKIYRVSLIIVFIFAISSTIFSIIGPKILGNATQEIYIGIINKLNGVGGLNFAKIHHILITLLILYLLSSISTYLENFIMSTITQKYTFDLREKVSKKIHKLPFKYFDSKNHGEVLSIVTNDIDTLQMSFNQALTQLITSITTVVGIFIMMLSIDIYMTLLTLLILPLSIIFMSFIVKISQKYFAKNQEYLGNVNGSIEEMLSGHTIVKAFNAEDDVIEDFEEKNNLLFEAGFKSQFFSGLMHPIMMFIGNLGYVLTAIVGGYFAIIGRITVGNIQSFISYSKNFTQPITQIAQVLNQIQSALAAGERIFDFLESPEEEKGDLEFDYNNSLGNVEFKHVKFGYNDKIIIKDFSCKVNSGEKVAIVGPTGAGKSTIVKLLMHFYNLNDGEITIDGENIDLYNPAYLRKTFGMVLQDTWLYSGTIMDNLRYGKLEATDEEVINAAKIANVDHFIKTLPDGYNMVIDEEMTNISQGQKQLLTIARAILADAKILILDEATSSVDTRTEQLIQDAMDKLMKGRTSFIIAHRLSTIKNADKILVMDDGDIVEIGTHEELLAKDGFYAKLYNSQFEN